MTTFTAITNAQIDAESYIDTVLAAQWRDNVLAIQEGDATAPDIAAKTGASTVLLSTQTASASASLDFTSGIDSTYSSYEFRFDGILPATDGVRWELLVSTDGGSTFLTTGVYDYLNYGQLSSGTTISDEANNTSSLPICGVVQVVGNQAEEGLTGQLTLNRPDSTSLEKRMYGQTCHTVNNGNTALTSMAGVYNVGGTAMNAIRFKFNSGNIASGVVRMYGIKDS